MGMDVKAKGVKSDINITPLVDVVLVLLIIFMVITPLAQRGYDIEIPKEADSVAPPVDDPNRPKNIMLAVSAQDCNVLTPVTTTLPGDCRVRINDDAVLVTDLPRRMDEIYRARRRAEKILFVAVEEKLNYGAVVKILDVAKNAVGEDLKLAIVSDEKLAVRQASADIP